MIFFFLFSKIIFGLQIYTFSLYIYLQQFQMLNSQQELVQYQDASASNMHGNIDDAAEPDNKEKKYGFFSLFRFADKVDKVLIMGGAIFSLISGAATSIFALIWGENIDKFKSADSLVEQTYQILLKFIYIGIGVLLTAWVAISCWSISGFRQITKCKKRYVESLLSQQVGWFESSNQSQITSSYSIDIMAYQEAIGHDISFIINVLGIAIAGIAIAFSKGWMMALVLLSSIPLIVLAKYMYSQLNMKKQKKQEKFYSEAAVRAQQALYAIKTVKMLNGQNFEFEKYKGCLQKTKKGSRKFSLIFGSSVGLAQFFILSTFAFGLWYGSQCIRSTSSCPGDQTYTAGTVFTVFFSMVLISFHMSHLPYNLKKVMAGRVSSERIYRVIDRQPKIKNPTNGIILSNFKGVIRFNNVSFSYPKDPKTKILDKINFQITEKKIALVGNSGCGKSTILQLLMRFYDPTQGQITIDGVNLKNIDLIWWRQQIIGYVGQEPVLFATSIRQNLLFSSQNSTELQLQEALKKAQVFNFVNSLQKKLDTYVGTGGGQISGGQKQRIAIARAIVRKPKLLILDQATSALDKKTQKSIQKTLNVISQGIISITIAHRVETIVESDQIFVIEKGKVKQSGRFKELNTFEKFKIQKVNQLESKNNEGQQIQKVQQREYKLQPKQDQPLQNEQKVNNILFKLLSYSKQNCILGVLVAILSIITGSAFPVSTIFLAQLINEMLIPQNPHLQQQTNRNSLIVFLIAILCFLACAARIFLLQRIGQNISIKIRLKTFMKLLKLPISWHDKEQNKLSVLTTKLSSGAFYAKQLATTSVYTVFEIFFCLGSAIVISFIFSWRLALVELAFLPINLFTAGFTSKYRNGQISGQQQEKSAIGIINEAVGNIKTVYSLAYEKKIYQKYSQILLKPFKSQLKSAIISGFLYGLGQCLIFVLISTLFYIGSLFIKSNGVLVKDTFIVIFAVFFATSTTGQIANFLSNINKCITASEQIFGILNEKDEGQIQVEQKSRLIKDKTIEGNIQLRNIKFRHFSRSHYLFNGFNLSIKKGDKVAFVGSSGCGKSTIMAFLLRFYDPQSGQILIDGINIKDYEIHHLRSQFGVVGQEPVIFNASFRSNILYNLQASEQQMVEAARKSKAFDFINKFIQNKAEKKSADLLTRTLLQPLYQIQEFLVQSSNSIKKQVVIKVSKINSNSTQSKGINMEAFNRYVGVKGGEISGGQKQRLAIARAIIRKPNVLLLDQATSALDAQNEKKVMENLDTLMENKTSINIAHRLETIANSDVIYVFDKGVITEKGTYQDLMSKKGYFYNLEKGYGML